MKNKAMWLALFLALAGPAQALTSISAYKTFTREILTSADLNASISTLVTGINEARAKFPGDSTKTGTGAFDTLAANPGPNITVKDPLVGLTSGDSIKFARASLTRISGDTLWLGSTPVAIAFSGGGTAGKRWRFNLADIDSARFRDSTLWLPGAKFALLAGATATAAYIDVDTLAGGQLFTGAITQPAGQRATLSYLDADTLAGAGAVVPDNYIFGLGSGKATVEFDDQTVDEVNVLNAQMNIGTSTGNSNVTVGVTVAQGANDDKAIVASSTDVTHGMTSQTETNSYFEVGKYSATAGGVDLRGLADGGGNAIALSGYAPTPSTTHTASGTAIIQFYSASISGTSPATPGANSNLFGAGDNTGALRFIVDQEGDLFADGSAPTIYDGYDDVALLSTFDHHEARVSNQQIMESEWEDYTRYNEQDLIEMGLIGGPRVGVPANQRGLINYTGMVRLHNGAIRQVGREVNKLDDRTEKLMEEVEYLKAVRGPNPTWDDVELVAMKWAYSLFGKGN